MNADKYFGKELADEIRETSAYAKKLDDEEKLELAKLIRDEAEKKGSSKVVHEVLNRLADIIESEAEAG